MPWAVRPPQGKKVGGWRQLEPHWPLLNAVGLRKGFSLPLILNLFFELCYWRGFVLWSPSVSLCGCCKVSGHIGHFCSLPPRDFIYFSGQNGSWFNVLPFTRLTCRVLRLERWPLERFFWGRFASRLLSGRIAARCGCGCLRALQIFGFGGWLHIVHGVTSIPCFAQQVSGATIPHPRRHKHKFRRSSQVRRVFPQWLI